MDEPKKIMTNSAIILGRKSIPAGKILIVGRDINQEEFETLRTMGKEASEITGAVPEVDQLGDLKKQLKDAHAIIKDVTEENGKFRADLDLANDTIAKLNAENEALIAENSALTAERDALATDLAEVKAALDNAPGADADGKKEKAKK